jgi:hypothetical protein
MPHSSLHGGLPPTRRDGLLGAVFGDVAGLMSLQAHSVRLEFCEVPPARHEGFATRLAFAARVGVRSAFFLVSRVPRALLSLALVVPPSPRSLTVVSPVGVR